MSKGFKLRCLVLARKMKRIVSRQDKLNRTMTHAEKLAEEVAEELRSMVDNLGSEELGDDDGMPVRRMAEVDRDVLIPVELAHCGGLGLHLEADGAKQILVRVEARREFSLGGRPAQLLRILWEESQRGQGGWKDAGEIGALLPQQDGIPSSRHVISNLASRLRKDLARAGVDPALVECDQRLGYRLALRPAPRAPVVDEIAGVMPEMNAQVV
ncbi:MAG: hypothetical protein AB2A00_37210 [Myxococcota bacterium]